MPFFFAPPCSPFFSRVSTIHVLQFKVAKKVIAIKIEDNNTVYIIIKKKIQNASFEFIVKKFTNT